MATDLNSKADDVDEKPDINDVPMEENEVRCNTVLFESLQLFMFFSQLNSQYLK